MAILPVRVGHKKNWKYLGPTGFLGINLQTLDHRSHAMWWKIKKK
jgi:hypothetical protein